MNNFRSRPRRNFGKIFFFLIDSWRFAQITFNKVEKKIRNQKCLHGQDWDSANFNDYLAVNENKQLYKKVVISCRIPVLDGEKNC